MAYRSLLLKEKLVNTVFSKNSHFRCSQGDVKVTGIGGTGQWTTDMCSWEPKSPEPGWDQVRIAAGTGSPAAAEFSVGKSEVALRREDNVNTCLLCRELGTLGRG